MSQDYINKKFPIKEVDFSENILPEYLENIPSPPERLYYRGSFPSAEEFCITVVGTRRATSQGKEAAGSISRGLAEFGMVVVSGLARGIDGAAHRGVLKAKGRTIAVMAGGLDKIYPKEHEELALNILEQGGALISEYPVGSDSMPNNFLERNRIVSGLSKAVIIVEAPLRSGAISTAHHGLEQGREIFVVPGPVNHSNYFGSHKLLRDGARIVTSARDVIEDLDMGK